ncbi:helix-turn-helix transcriptional regulator, partial [Staphylococcus epidermidis]
IELSYLKKPKLDVNKNFYLSEDIHQYLVDHHDSKINKHELAEAVNLSNQALTSMFKQTPFQTFNQYLNQLRLKFCLIDILTTHKPIEEIAIDHGFHHYSRFIQLFKNTYGYTPKLIRRDYIATSIFKNTAEEIDLDRHFLMNIHELQDLDSKIISKKYIEMSDKGKKYRSYDIYIEDNRSTILDQEQIVHIKRNLSLSQKSMRYVIELNYTSMIENKELCRYEMLKILRFCSGLNLIPTFKIITDRHDTFTSKEKMALKLTFQMLFIMLREFNQLEIEFIVEDMMLKQVVQLKKMISSYFEYYKLNYRIKNEKIGNVNYQNLEKQVTQIFIPID